MNRAALWWNSVSGTVLYAVTVVASFIMSPFLVRHLGNGVYGRVFSPQPCLALIYNFYQNSSSCQGTPAPASYWSGHCNYGESFTCSGNSSSVKAVASGVQRTIKLDKSRLRFL